MNVAFRTLGEWLQWQESLHPTEIDLGLERVKAVYKALKLQPPACVITVGGTNGKGSCIALLEQLYLAAGFRVGSYTSPHLQQYNERVRINSEPVSDQLLVDAFSTINEARGEQSLTYFEFGTLAALLIFAQGALDVILLEVGMGGRLDATNIIDPDVSIITSIGLDHQEWLGDTREAIAREKAGIMRAGKPVICADRQPPASLLRCAEEVGASLYLIDHAFSARSNGASWSWAGQQSNYPELPFSSGSMTAYMANAAAAIQAAELLKPCLPFSQSDLVEALPRAAVPGRCFCWSEQPEIWLDVAHNPDACEVLLEHLMALPAKKTHLLIGVLQDKDAKSMLSLLNEQVHYYHLVAPDAARAMPVEQIEGLLPDLVDRSQVRGYGNIQEAMTAILPQLGADSRLVVTGSFYTVAEAMATGAT